MLFDDTYRTIAAPAEGIFRDRGSKFLGFAYPLENEAALKEILLQLKSAHPKANHHCWALRLGIDRSVFRLNDDGEPAGTAGRPVLNTLLSKDLTNIVVVVVRYFGGTLLGVPGLINAYKTVAVEALDGAVIIQKTLNDIYTIYFGYLQMNDIMLIIKEADLSIKNQQFDTECSIQVSIRKTEVNQVLARLAKIDGVKVTYNYTG
jgi:uncharacterized YigZ family protein